MPSTLLSTRDRAMNKSDKASALQGRRGLGTNKSYGGNGYMKNIILPRNKCQEERKKTKWIESDRERGWLHFRGERRDHFDVMTSKQQTEDICQSKITTRRKRQANLKNRRYNIPKTGIGWFVQETAKSSDSILRVTGSFWKILIKKSDSVIYVFKNTTLLLWDR